MTSDQLYAIWKEGTIEDCAYVLRICEIMLEDLNNQDERTSKAIMGTMLKTIQRLQYIKGE